MDWTLAIVAVWALAAVGTGFVLGYGDQRNIASIRSKMQERRDMAAWRFAGKISDGDDFLRAYLSDDSATLRRRWPQFWQEMHAQDAVISDWRS